MIASFNVNKRDKG